MISQVYQFLNLQKSNPDIFKEADKQKHGEQISVAAGVVLETIEDLLVSSKTQMLKFTSSPENLHIAQTVKNINELLQTQLQKKNILLATVISQSVDLKQIKIVSTFLFATFCKIPLLILPKKVQ